MQLNINLGGKVFICATPQNADLDAAGFGALTWVQITSVGSVGEMGTAQNMPSYDMWDKSMPATTKGMISAESAEIEVARDTTDAGQDLLRLAAVPTDKRAYAIKVEKSDKLTAMGTNTILYNRAVVTGPSRPQGRAEDIDIEVFTAGWQQVEVSVDPT